MKKWKKKEILKFIVFLLWVPILIVLSLPPVYSTTSELYIDIEFPSFYNATVENQTVPIIGLRGVTYTGLITICACKDNVSLKNKTLKIRFIYDEPELINGTFFLIDTNPINEKEKIIEYDLSEKIGLEMRLGETKNINFTIMFGRLGNHGINVRLYEGNKPIDSFIKFYTIVDPVEYENLETQKRLLNSQIAYTEASKEMANQTKYLVWVTGFLAIVAAGSALYTYRIAKEAWTPVAGYKISPFPNNPYYIAFSPVNYCKQNLRVWAKLNATVYGRPVEHGGFYSGESPWDLLPYGQEQGYFQIANLLSKANRTIEEMENSASGENANKQLRFKIEFWYEGIESGKKGSTPEREFYFDFRTKSLVRDV